MEFEWDAAKAAENERKHGISFEEAVAMWNDVAVEVEGIASSEEGEKRNATMGLVAEKAYVAIWTWRKGKARLISVRRARKNEEKIFFKKIQDER